MKIKIKFRAVLKEEIMTARIIGTGSYVPERVVRNADLAEIVDTSDEWIVSRTTK